MSKIKLSMQFVISALQYWSSSNTDDEAPSTSCMCMRTIQGIWIAQVEYSQCCKGKVWKGLIALHLQIILLAITQIISCQILSNIWSYT